MELEETIEYYHPNVSDRIPDHILWVRHHTKLLPGKLCLSGNCVVTLQVSTLFMMTFPVFVIVQKIKVPSNHRLSHMASLAFGIYLSHYVFVFIAYDLLDTELLPYTVRIICMACIVFLTCYAIVWLMSKSKLTNRFIR